MESQPQHPELRINPENFYLCALFALCPIKWTLGLYRLTM